jgi:hypothetical protein
LAFGHGGWSGWSEWLVGSYNSSRLPGDRPIVTCRAHRPRVML